MRSILLAIVAVGGFTTLVAVEAIPYEQILLSAQLTTSAAAVAIGFALGWRRTAAALSVAVGAGAAVLIATQLHRANLEPLAWLVMLLLAATQLPLGRRAGHRLLSAASDVD